VYTVDVGWALVGLSVVGYELLFWRMFVKEVVVGRAKGNL
jgi:hypothetical protein